MNTQSKSYIALKYFGKALIVFIISAFIMLSAFKIGQNLIQNSTSRVSSNKHIIEETLEYSSYSAQDQLEELRDIKENIEIFIENEVNKFKNKTHKFHIEKVYDNTNNL